MKVRRGIEKIGSFQKVDLMVDWDSLFRFKGKLAQRTRAERMLGGILSLLGYLLIAVFIAWLVLNSQWTNLGIIPVNSMMELSFWIGLGFVIYSSYLKRNRNVFAFDLSHLKISQLLERIQKGKLKQVRVDDLFSFKVIQVIDDGFFAHQRDFVDDMIAFCVKDSEVKGVMDRLGIDSKRFESDVLGAAKHIDTSFETHYQGLFTAVLHKAVELEFEEIGPLCFWFVFARHLWKDQLLNQGISEKEITAIELWLKTENKRARYYRLWHRLAYLKPTGTVNRAYTSRYSPTIEAFAEDYTATAANGRFELTMGRDDLLAELESALQRRDQASLLVGAPGVGKTRLLRHLAVKMVVEDVPEGLRDKRLVVFNFTRAFTSVQSLKDFKSILQRLFDELLLTKDVIIVLDEIEQMLNVRSEFQSEIINVLENGIRDKNLQIVATTSLENYRRFIEPVRGLASLFEVMVMEEPQGGVALQILVDAAKEFEKDYPVDVRIKALEEVVKLAPSFDHERVMPDKAIDLLEECLIEARNGGEGFLSVELVSKVVSRKVGVKVGKMSSEEAELLSKIEDKMHQRVVGQKPAIRAVAAALKRARVGFEKGNKPLASFLFFGPTGVGKTEVAKTLAATYYGDEKLMIRLDMSEFQEEENLERLIGKLEGNKFSGGYLTEEVRRKPFSLILLDELEKANPKVLDLFLQVLDEGNLTDGAGRKISFKNNIIIATSNVGSRKIAEMVGQGRKYDEIRKEIQEELRTVYRVEFLNRFDEVIMFSPLSMIEVKEIARRMMEVEVDKMLDQGIRLEYSEVVLSRIAELGYNPVYGARELSRAIKDQVEDVVAEKIIKGEVGEGGVVRLTD